MIAVSFSRLFFRNAINEGLPVVELAGGTAFIRNDDRVQIDFEKGTVTHNGKSYKFPATSEGSPRHPERRRPHPAREEGAGQELVLALRRSPSQVTMAWPWQAAAASVYKGSDCLTARCLCTMAGRAALRGDDMARIAVDEKMIAAFCREHRIRRLALFGSALRDDFRPESDVDVLVEFEPGAAPGLCA